MHDRTVSLRLDGALVARGRVRTQDGYEPCKSRVLVKILRNGETIDEIRTRSNGRFRVSLPDKPGRYVAVAPQVVADDTNLCARARSRTRKV